MNALLALVLISCAPLLHAQDPNTFESDPQVIPLDGGVVWLNVEGPSAYPSATPRDVPADAIQVGGVQGKACQRGLSVPFTTDFSAKSGKVSGAAGRGGYEKAIEQIHKTHPDLRGLYDVQVDLHEIRILSIYTQLCTEIAARAFR